MFNRLALWQRLVVLSLAFMIPALALLYFLVGEQSLAIDFARKELAGVEYLRAVRPLLANLLAERDLRLAAEAGDASRAGERSTRAGAIERDIAALRERARTLAIPLATAGELDAIQRVWGTPEQRAREAGTAVIDELLRHVVAVGNESNLVLDPDVDSYYCMDAVVFKLPKLLNELSDVRGQAFGVLARHDRGSPAGDGGREVLQALRVALREALVAAGDNVEFGYRFNPFVEQRLDPSFRETETRVERILATLASAGPEPDAGPALFEDATAALDATFQSWDIALETLEYLIERRITIFEGRRLASLSIVAISLLVGVGIVFSIQRYMEARNRDLSQALDRLTETQSQLVEAEKMAALGNLVAGIAHEINTPLGIGVTAATSLDDETRRLEALAGTGAMKRSDLSGYVTAARELSGLVLSNLNRASTLIQSFKQVAVDQSSESRRRFAVNAYLHEVLQSLSPHLRKTGHTVTVTCDDALMLDSYPGALSQIITNLLTNALVHAFEPGDHGTIRLHATAVAGGVRLTFSDDGKGVPREHADKIFDPFFTTKRGQGGSGLGLHIVYNLVTQRMGGRVRFESTAGGGATFVIDLPDFGAGTAA
ncbi:MAG: sensor histidine kinase [Vicinamibacterales bacterium]